jgi:hypothetical protein
MTSAVTVEASFSDGTPPSESWVAPVGDEQVFDVYNQMVQLDVDASDAGGIDLVIFSRWDYVSENWIDIGSVYSSPYLINFDASTLLPDWNQVDADAYDNAGNVTSKYIWLNKLAQTYSIYLPLVIRR